MVPNDSNALHVAQHLLGIGRQYAALGALERASSDEIETPEYWAIRAEALGDLGRHDESVEAARRGLALDPRDVHLLDVLAMSELERGFPEEAGEALTEALELSPQNPVLLAHRAYLFARCGMFDAAGSAVEQAMRVAPDWRPVLQTRAQVAILANDKRASEYVDDLLRLDPADPVAHALRGNLAIEQKRLVSASHAFDEAARLHPGDAQIAEVAREVRVHAHPVLVPARAMWRFGRWRSYFLYLSVIGALAATGLESVRVAVIGIWLAVVILSWFGPPIIRRFQNRRYGGF